MVNYLVAIIVYMSYMVEALVKHVSEWFRKK